MFTGRIEHVGTVAEIPGELLLVTSDVTVAPETMSICALCAVTVSSTSCGSA